MKAAILAGGLAKRLRPLTNDKPKPIVEVCGRPIIEWQILWLKRFGVEEFVILAGYMWNKLIEYLGSGVRLGVKLAYVIEDEPLGTGGAIKNSRHILGNEGTFMVLNGDIITDLDPRPLINVVSENEMAVAGIALVRMRSPYGIIKVSGGYVEEFHEKPLLEYFMNAGIYVMKPEIFDYLPEKGDVERTTFPKLASERRLKAWAFEGCYWRSINTIKDIEEASEELRVMKF